MSFASLPVQLLKNADLAGISGRTALVALLSNHDGSTLSSKVLELCQIHNSSRSLKGSYEKSVGLLKLALKVAVMRTVTTARISYNNGLFSNLVYANFLASHSGVRALNMIFRDAAVLI